MCDCVTLGCQTIFVALLSFFAYVALQILNFGKIDKMYL